MSYDVTLIEIFESTKNSLREEVKILKTRNLDFLDLLVDFYINLNLTEYEKTLVSSCYIADDVMYSLVCGNVKTIQITKKSIGFIKKEAKFLEMSIISTIDFMLMFYLVKKYGIKTKKVKTFGINSEKK